MPNENQTPLSSTQDSTVKRNVETQLVVAAGFTNIEITAREFAASRMKIIPLTLRDFLHSPNLPDSPSNLVSEMDVAGKQVFNGLKERLTPIGQATLPKEAPNLYRYEGFMEKHFQQAAFESGLPAGKETAKELSQEFFERYAKDMGLSSRVLKGLRYGNWALGLTSAGIVAYEIAESEDRVKETFHQATLIAAGMTGALAAGQASVAPCAVFGPYGVICVGSASVLGGIAGTEMSERIFQLSAQGELSRLFSHIFSPQAHAAEDLTGQLAASKVLVMQPLQDKVSYPALNHLAQRYYTTEKRKNQMDLGLALKDSWYTLAKPATPLEQMYNQFQALHYLTQYHSYFMRPQGRTMLANAQEQLSAQVNAYQPKNPAEAVQWYALKDKVSVLSMSSRFLTDTDKPALDNMHPTAKQALDNIKDPHVLYETLRSIPREELTHNPDNQAVLFYVDNHVEVVNLTTEERDRLIRLQVSTEMAFAIGKSAEAGMALAHLANARGNQALGDGLMLSSAALSGISSAMLYSTASGAAAIGYAAGGIGAVATIATVLLSQKSDNKGLQEVFNALFHYLDILLKQLNVIQAFLVAFRPELYERLNIHFGALQLQMTYMMEVTRNGQKITAFQLDQLRSLLVTVLSYFKDDIIYQAKDYFDGVIDRDKADRKTMEPLLSRLWMLLDKSISNYESGVDLCEKAVKHSQQIAKADVASMLNNPLERGQLYGYLSCYYQLKQWKNTSSYLPIVNHVQWNSLMELYIFLRYAPSIADTYDTQHERIDTLNSRGKALMDFIHDTQQNTPDWIQILLAEVILHIHETLAALDYPEKAKKLVQCYPLPEPVRKILQNGWEGSSQVEISELYASMAAVGLGDFETKQSPCQNVPDTQRTSIKFSFLNGATHFLAKQVGPSGRLNACFLFPAVGPEEKSRQNQQLKDCFLAARRQFSGEQAERLKETLPKAREKITEASLHIKALLIAAGYPKVFIEKLPELSFPDELSSWIAPYEVDTHHDDAYRALPSSPQIKEALQLYLTNIREYQVEILAYNTTDAHALYNPDSVTTALTLMELNALKSYLLYPVIENITRVEENITHLTEAIPKGYTLVPDSEFARLTQKITSQEQELMRIRMLLELLLEKQGISVPEVLVQKGIAEASVLSTESSWSCVSHPEFSAIALCQDPDNPYHGRLTYNLMNVPWNQTIGLAPDCRRLETGLVHCEGEGIEFFEYTLATTEIHTSALLSLSLHAGLIGFISTFIMEAIHDSLSLLCKGTRHLETTVQTAINVVWLAYLLYITEHWYEALLRMVVTEMTRRACDHVGIKKEWSHAIARTVGIFATNPEKPNLKDAVLLSAQLIGSELGMWTEKKCAAQLR